MLTQTDIKRAMGETCGGRYSQTAYIPAVLRRHCPDAHSILDVGCGSGDLLAATDYPVRVGLDPESGAQRETTEKGIECHAGWDDLDERMDDSTWLFGIVTLVDVLEHCDRAGMLALLGECVRHVKPGGHLFIQTDNPRSLLAHLTHYDDASHVRMYSERQVRAILECLDMRVVARGDHVMHPCRCRAEWWAVLAYRLARYGWGTSLYERYWLLARKDGRE